MATYESVPLEPVGNLVMLTPQRYKELLRAEHERDAAVAQVAALREAAQAVLPSTDELDFYERMLATKERASAIEPYYAEKWRKTLALRAALAAASAPVTLPSHE